MQVNDLNRTLNHILAGTLSLIALGFLFWEKVVSIATYLYQQSNLQAVQLKDIAPTAPLVAAILIVVTPVLLAVAFLLGLVVEGIADVVIQELFLYQLIYKSASVRWVFWCKKGHLLNTQLRERYEALLREDKKYALAKTTVEERKTIATALFFQNSSQDQIKWALYNYTVYLLASGYAVIIMVFLAGIVWNQIPFGWAIPLLVFLYSLLYVAADRERYVYEVVYREAIIVLSEKSEESEAPKESTVAQLPTSEVISAQPTLPQTDQQHQRADRRR